jgi:hypothetical protein
MLCSRGVALTCPPPWRAEHKDTAFAGGAAGGDRRWQAAVRLRQTKFRDFLEHNSNPPAKKTGAIRATSVRQMEAIDPRRKASRHLIGFRRDQRSHEIHAVLCQGHETLPSGSHARRSGLGSRLN